MNLNEINTVSELVAANQIDEPTTHNDESLYELVLEELDYPEAVKLAIRIVNQLALFHQNTRNEMLETEPERSAMWAYDEALLSVALDQLNRIVID
jgi:hypothetical protein